MDVNETILAEAADDVPIEAFIKNNNARDKGQPVEPLAIKPHEESKSESGAGNVELAETQANRPAERSTHPADVSRPKARETPQQRIDKAVAKQREAERELQAAKDRAAALEAQIRAQSQPAPRSTPLEPTRPVAEASGNDPEPTIEQFAKSADPYTDHLKAWNRWAARQEVRAEHAKQRQVGERQRAHQVYQTRTARMTEKLEAYKKDHPDYTEKIRAAAPLIDRYLLFSTPDAIGTPLGDLVLDSDNPPQLVVWFAEHQQDLQRIATLHPLLQAKALGEIEGRIAAANERPSATPRAISSANPPIKPPVGSPVVSASEGEDDADDLSEAALNAHIRRENSRSSRHPHLSRRR